MLKREIKLSSYVLIISFVNLLLYHFPIFEFTFKNANYKSLSGIILVISLAILIIVLNALVFYIGLYISRFLGKFLLVLFAIINSVSIYFINTYGVIIDKSMIGNVLNTNLDESSSFFSLNLFFYLILLGIIPSILLLKVRTYKVKFSRFMMQISFALVFIASLIYANASNWLWIDKHSKSLGGLAMPWSYVVNINRFYLHKSQKNKKEILLPNATIKDNKKAVMVLVIGESARSQNFSLYGYEKNTNPLLSKIENIHTYKSESCATFTTAGVKCILEHKNTSKLFEILPNYLFRNNVEVIWRTTNAGEPPVHIKNYQKRKDLKKNYDGNASKYDEILLNNINEQILASEKDKILIILHTSTNHGPTYYKKYPEKFNKFTPVCKSVELSKCTNEELINAYDNTILYTDYILATLINDLKKLDQYNSSVFYVSDHGESLGENNLYMHGLPVSIAPKEQLEIPFIVWFSDNSIKLKENKEISQHYVFHSILNFLSIDSPVYNDDLSIFKK